jgi:helix-turn-helix protein
MGKVQFTGQKINLEVRHDDTIFDTMKQETTEFYTTKEVQKMLKVSRATLHRWRKAKKIKAKRFQGVVRYKLSDIKKVMQ